MSDCLFLFIYSMFLSVFLSYCHFLHFPPLGTASARARSCLLSLTAGLARSGRDGWTHLAGGRCQPGNARRPGASAETVQMDLTCCCLPPTVLYSHRTSPPAPSHMCLKHTVGRLSPRSLLAQAENWPLGYTFKGQIING